MQYKTVFHDDKTVVVVAPYDGKSVRGVAKCHPNDKFTLEFGEELAQLRCAAKISCKRRKQAQKDFENLWNEHQYERMKFERKKQALWDRLQRLRAEESEIASRLAKLRENGRFQND